MQEGEERGLIGFGIPDYRKFRTEGKKETGKKKESDSDKLKKNDASKRQQKDKQQLNDRQLIIQYLHKKNYRLIIQSIGLQYNKQH